MRPDFELEGGYLPYKSGLSIFIRRQEDTGFQKSGLSGLFSTARNYKQKKKEGSGGDWTLDLLGVNQALWPLNNETIAALTWLQCYTFIANLQKGRYGEREFSNSSNGWAENVGCSNKNKNGNARIPFVLALSESELLGLSLKRGRHLQYTS